MSNNLELLKDLDPESIRAKTLYAVRDFKSSWIRVAHCLTQIAYGGDYKEFGFDDFEEYVCSELRLSMRQVKKLMVSYSYLKKNKPELWRAYLTDVGNKEISLPGYEAINDLQSAEGNLENYDESKIEEVKAKLLDGEITGREATRGIREAKVVVDADPTVKGLQKLVKAYKQLHHLAVHNERVPDSIVREIEEVSRQLEALV